VAAVWANPKPLLPWIVTSFAKRSAVKECMARKGDGAGDAGTTGAGPAAVDGSPGRVGRPYSVPAPSLPAP
jgi:hypothetical protein